MTHGRPARTATLAAASAASMAVLTMLTVLTGCGGGTSSATAPGDAPSGAAGGGSSPTAGPATSAGEPGVVTAGPGPDATPTGVTQVVTGTGGATGSGAPVPWDVSAMPSPASLPRRDAGTAKLTILLDDGFGIRTSWTLTCNPAGGTHPDPATACGVLGAKGSGALPEPKARACTEQYGGPQKARITGTWRGAKVDSQLSLENGCEIDRWTALLGLLPPGGLPG